MTTTKCIKCEGSGIYYRPNGPEDFDPEYCICVEGELAEKAGALRVLRSQVTEEQRNDAWAMVAHND